MIHPLIHYHTTTIARFYPKSKCFEMRRLLVEDNYYLWATFNLSTRCCTFSRYAKNKFHEANGLVSEQLLMIVL